MKILILSPSPWQKDRSFGNTYSNIFGKMEGIEIAHIYFYDGKPDYEHNVTRYYQIPEREVVNSILKFWKNNKGAGREVFLENKTEKGDATYFSSHKGPFYQRLLSLGKRYHWRSFFFARELAWKLGKINYDGLMAFIQDFKPDLFFLPYNNIFYSNRLAYYIRQRLDVPMVIEMGMDHYSLKRVSWNPFFWADRFAKRAMIRKLVKEYEKMFVISKKLKIEIEEELSIPCEVLYKTPDENRSFCPYKPKGDGEKIEFLFTGNIYANRWKTLAMLANELKNQRFGKLNIYTSTPLSEKMKKALNIDGYSEIHPPVVLVHAEAFDKFNKSLVRCAISTKIMDYLSVGRCVMAIGPADISSVEYIAEDNMGLVANSRDELRQVIQKVKTNPQILADFAEKGRNHTLLSLNPSIRRKVLHNSLQEVIDHYVKRNHKNE